MPLHGDHVIETFLFPLQLKYDRLFDPRSHKSIRRCPDDAPGAIYTRITTANKVDSMLRQKMELHIGMGHGAARAQCQPQGDQAVR